MALKDFKDYLNNRVPSIQAMYEDVKREIAEINAGVPDDDSITAAKLKADAVETDKIKNAAVTAVKLATDAVTASKIAAKAVTAGKINDGAVNATAAKLVTREITVAAEGKTGTATNAADIDGVVLGAYPKTDVESAILSVALTAASGKIDVALATNQSAGKDGKVEVVVLQA